MAVSIVTWPAERPQQLARRAPILCTIRRHTLQRWWRGLQQHHSSIVKLAVRHPPLHNGLGSTVPEAHVSFGPHPTRKVELRRRAEVAARPEPPLLSERRTQEEPLPVSSETAIDDWPCLDDART